MQRTFLTFNELEKKCPCAYAIQAVAEAQNLPGEKWNFQVVTIDEENENLYHSVYVLPDAPGSKLEFDYELLPNQEPGYRCSIICKKSNGQEPNGR